MASAFCTNCGSQLPEGSKFCTKCGTPTPAIISAPASAMADTASLQPEIPELDLPLESAERTAEPEAENASALPVEPAPIPEPAPIAEPARDPEPTPVPNPVPQWQPAPTPPRAPMPPVTPPPMPRPVAPMPQAPSSPYPQSWQPPVQAQQRPVPPMHPGAYNDSPPPPTSKYALMGAWETLGSIILMNLPLAGIIITIIWACGGCQKLSRRNLARAYLLLFAIGLVLTILVALVFRFVFADSLTQIFEQIFDGYTIEWGM